MDDWPVLQCFYNGLTTTSRANIDAAAGRAFLDLTIAKAKELVEKMVSNQGWSDERLQPYTKGMHTVTLGFQYQGTADSSRYSEEEISDEELFSRVQRLLRDVKKIPFVPDTLSTANPPKQVFDKSSRYVVIEYFTLV